MDDSPRSLVSGLGPRDFGNRGDGSSLYSRVAGTSVNCGGYEKELFEGHPELAKAALAEDERVEFQHFVTDGHRRRARCEDFGKLVWFMGENRPTGVTGDLDGASIDFIGAKRELAV